LVGTAAYLSPEQAAGRAVTPASDIYSLGVVGYECLAGHRPFSGDSAIGIAMAHVNSDPPPLPDTVPPVVADFVMRALHKDPARRQPSAGDFGRTALALAVQLREAQEAAAAPTEAVHTAGPTQTAVMTTPPIAVESDGLAGSDDDDRHRRRVRNGFIATGAVVVLLGFLLLHSCANGGIDTARVPKLVGDTYSDATHILHARGFEVRRVGVHRQGAAAGTVVAQSAKRGTELQVGSTVTLQVSTGPSTVTIDAADFIGRPGDEVQHELNADHLQVLLLSLPSSAPAGTVIAVDPTGDVQEGTTVTVTVATAKAPPPHGKAPKSRKDEHGGHG
jgi:serine/threonine-protein kinase